MAPLPQSLVVAVPKNLVQELARDEAKALAKAKEKVGERELSAGRRCVPQRKPSVTYPPSRPNGKRRVN